MILMATSRRRKGGGYDDEEQSRYRFDYLSGHLNKKPGLDGFKHVGKKRFEAAFHGELHRLHPAICKTPKVGIYLHGYNNDYQESIDELVDMHDHLEAVIGYPPILIGFSWPSSGKVTHYLADREEARDSVPAFIRFLQDVNGYLVKHERDCFSTAFCVAHSMGNYLLRKGLEYFSDHLGTPSGRMMFSETVMLAPDLSSRDMETYGKGSYIADFSRRVHVYYSRHDRALKASSKKRFGGNRLGRHGPEDFSRLPGNVIGVNAEEYAKSSVVNGILDRRKSQVSVHSSHRYEPHILADVASVLSSIDRDQIGTRIPFQLPDGTTPHPRSHYELI